MIRKLLTISSLTAFALAMVPSDVSATLFRDEMTDGASWGMNASSADTAATFNYDYSADAIPEAPNSMGGDAATRGVKLEANFDDTASGEFFTLYPTGQNFTGDLRLRFDAWMNFPAGSDFSTEFLGGGVGYDNVTADIASGAQAITTGDGGSSNDWRAFKSPPQFFIPDEDMAGGNHNAAIAYYADFLPSVLVPPAQGQPEFSASNPGSPAFQWITWEFATEGDIVKVTIEKPNGARRRIVTIDCGDTSDGSNGCATDGNISLFYADFFSSISDGPEFQFGIIDNVVVGVPEPTSLALLGLAALGLACVRRR